MMTRFALLLPLLLLVACSNAREHKSHAVNALAHLSFEAQRANTICADAYRVKRIPPLQAQKWAGTVADLKRWSEAICVRYAVAAPMSFHDLADASEQKLNEVLLARDTFCHDGLGRFPAAALAAPAARALFDVLKDWWESRQETPEEKDRAWQRLQAETERACARLQGLPLMVAP